MTPAERQEIIERVKRKGVEFCNLHSGEPIQTAIAEMVVDLVFDTLAAIREKDAQ